MNLTSATGLTQAQVAMRKALGRWRELYKVVKER